MGKFIIIKGTNFPDSPLGQVTPVAPEGYMVLKLTPSPVGNGFVNGSGIFKKNSVTNIFAEPTSDFYMWGDGSTEQDRIFNVGNSDIELKALFKDGNTLSNSFNSSLLKWEKGTTTSSGINDDTYSNWGRTQTLYAIPEASTIDFTTTFTDAPAIKIGYYDESFNNLANRYISNGSLPTTVNKNIPSGAVYIRICILKYGASSAENFDVNWLSNNITFILS